MIVCAFFFLKPAKTSISHVTAFIEAAQSEDVNSAYELLSPAMQAVVSKQDLSAFIERNTLASAQFSEWRSVNKNAAREILSSTLNTEDGVEKSLIAVLSNNSVNWQLDAMMFTEDPKLIRNKSATPSMQQMIELASSSVHNFGISLNTNSMAHFHSRISKLWQDQTNPEELKRAYQSFFDADLDLTVLEEVQPLLNGTPLQNDKGILEITGFFPTRPSKLSFEQRFIWEGLNWKLISFTANIN